MKSIKNIHVDSLETFRERAAAGWQDEEAKYHVWFNVKTKKLEPTGYGITYPVIYKNPLVDDHKHPDHFDTRKLNATHPKNAALLKHVFEVIERDGLIAKAFAAADKKERQRQAEAKEFARQERIKENGLRVFDALKKLERACYTHAQGSALLHTPVLSEAGKLLRELGE